MPIFTAACDPFVLNFNWSLNTLKQDLFDHTYLHSTGQVLNKCVCLPGARLARL
jgi:hypothetical protein